MKIKYYALSLLACCGLLSCSSDDVAENGGGGAGDSELSYMAVNIITSDKGSRATSTDNFTDGSDAENAIKDIRFYLFSATGDPYYVLKNGTASTNYVEPSSYTPDGDATKPSTVEEVGQAVLVFKGVKAAAPKYIIAVANCPSELTTEKGYSIDELKEVVSTGYSITDNSTTYYTMSSSVYVDGGKVMCEAEVKDANIKNDPAEAEKNPVQIFIERVAAKVTVDFKNSDKKINELPAYLVAGTEGTDAIYAKIIGWDVVGIPPQTYLLKDLSTSYTDLDITDWTEPDYHRSYWANIPTASVDNSFKFSEISKANGTSVYTKENTPTAALTQATLVDNDLTKVVIKAQLVDASNNAKPRYVYGGYEYPSETLVKAAILTTLNNFTGYFIRTGEENNYTYTPLQPNNLKFVSGKPNSTNGEKFYRSYPQFDDTTLDAGMLVEQTATGYSSITDYSSINTSLKNYYVNIWTEGYCYYYTTIRHLATVDGTTHLGKLGAYGVVRNHAYNVNITDIAGYGTPVYKPTGGSDDPNGDTPSVTPEPETPDEEVWHVAAQVNILQWRLVNSDVTITTD